MSGSPEAPRPEGGFDGFFDRHGADPARWPAEAFAIEQRDGAAPGWREAEARALRLEAALSELRRRRDVEIAAAGSGARVDAALAPSLPRRPAAYARWVALAATIVVAFRLGSVVELRAEVDPPAAEAEMVAGAPSIGPAEAGVDE